MTDAGQPMGTQSAGGAGLLVVLAILTLFWTSVIVELVRHF